ncbi:HAD family hydrolase [Paenibacillus psychroresistens]|uniref:HAD family hydrolase n=1 Tax=Paenibacillus psychroresistens TaxID=1778678 RepID=A0A6B8RAA7_9BACL|nr:HAD family hydrolase [Paenibacillus psychroresistens]QGQ93579.1 HAD family hydrolase [Paenibacillus psychroresistens]
MIELTIKGRSYPIRGLLFDKDGTLMSFITFWGKWCERLLYHFQDQLANCQVRIPEDWAQRIFGIVYDKYGAIIDYDRSGPLAMATTNDILAILCWHAYRFGLPWHQAMLIAQASQKTTDAEMNQLRPAQALAGLLPFLEQCRLHKLPLAVVTADDTTSAELHLEWMGIRAFFQTVIGHDQVILGKPNSEMVELACERLQLKPSEVAIIGDTDGDMYMGKAAGVALTIGILPQTSSNHDSMDLTEADVRIYDYEQLEITCSEDER